MNKKRFYIESVYSLEDQVVSVFFEDNSLFIGVEGGVNLNQTNPFVFSRRFGKFFDLFIQSFKVFVVIDWKAEQIYMLI